MALKHVEVESFLLTDNLGQWYEFTELAGAVRVRYTVGKRSATYNLPADEARALWRRLRRRGYERW